MSPAELQQYLHDNIPLTAAMEVKVVRADERVVELRAPLAPNINHRNTAFGGSIGAVATVAAWSWLHVQARHFGFPVRLVVRSSSVEFLAPIEGEFVTLCESPGETTYDAYRQAVIRKGKGRVELTARVEAAGRLCATFRGTFVAIRADEP